jgi:cell division septation protein DedD
MSPEPKPGVIGSLPRTRPHRRSAKRAASPAGAPPVDSQSAAEPEVVKAAAKPKPAAANATAASKPKRATTAAKTAAKPKRTAPRPKPTAPAERPPASAPADSSHGVLETAVQAAAELAEIGLHASARALRRAVSRLPRP